MIIGSHLHMPSYILRTFTEYPYIRHVNWDMVSMILLVMFVLSIKISKDTIKNNYHSSGRTIFIFDANIYIIFK